ncbi:MAG: hypothetical protein LBM98_04910 [Oscillospiraceae bacterium]|nr:hypothetical protein [Oscillospiraceae bacterium]
MGYAAHGAGKPPRRCGGTRRVGRGLRRARRGETTPPLRRHPKGRTWVAPRTARGNHPAAAAAPLPRGDRG